MTSKQQFSLSEGDYLIGYAYSYPDALKKARQWLVGRRSITIKRCTE